MTILENQSLRQHNTFRTGGMAKYFTEPLNTEDILEAIRFAKENRLKYMIVGNGSNLLFSDEGYDGLIIKTSKLKGIERDGETLKVYSGELTPSVGAFAAINGLTGFEPLSGIPGSIGGGIYMNCGAYGTEIGNLISKVCFLYTDGEIKIFDRSELDFSYRSSSFQHMDGMILWAELKLSEGDRSQIDEHMKDYAQRRKDKQPLEYPSAGSTFKRPEGHFAAKLIDDCGLKGLSVGGAEVSEKHAGFIINKKDATTKDIIELIEKVRKIVFEKTGVTLECEVKVVER